MTLGALVDLGLPEEWLRDFVTGLGIAEIGVRTERVQRLVSLSVDVKLTIGAFDLRVTDS